MLHAHLICILIKHVLQHPARDTAFVEGRAKVIDRELLRNCLMLIGGTRPCSRPSGVAHGWCLVQKFSRFDKGPVKGVEGVLQLVDDYNVCWPIDPHTPGTLLRSVRELRSHSGPLLTFAVHDSSALCTTNSIHCIDLSDSAVLLFQRYAFLLW